MVSDKNVLLKELELQDVFLFGDKELVLDAPLTIVTGRNGSGKTLLLDYIRLALGLKGRQSRFGRSGEFVFPGASEARITVTLRNPISEVHGHRVISSSNPNFNSEFLDSDEIFIQRRVTASGKWKVLLKRRDGTWVTLNSEQQASLQEALVNAGLNPKDELAFVDGEDFNMFISSNPHRRFEALMTKLQLSEGLTRGALIKEELKKRMEEREHLHSRIVELNKSLEALQEKEKRKRRIEELKQLLKDLEMHERWRKVVDAEKVLSTLKERQSQLTAELQSLSPEKKRLEREVDEVKERCERLERQKAEVESKWQRHHAELIRLQQQHVSLQQELRTLKQRLHELEGKRVQLSKQKDAKQQELDRMRSGNQDDRLRLQQKELKDVQQQYQGILQAIRDVEETVKSLERELDAIKTNQVKLEEEKKQLEAAITEKMRELRARVNVTSRGRSSYSPEILEFREKIKHLIAEKRVYGPLASVVSVQGLWKDDWTFAASLALKAVLTTFVAVDRSAFKEMEQLRRSHPRFQDISLGLARKRKPSLMEPLSSSKFQVLVTPVLAILTGPPEVLAFIQGQGGAVILAHDANHVPTEEIDELLKTQNSIRVITQSGEEYSANRWSVLSRTIRKKKLSTRDPLLGTPLSTRGSGMNEELASSTETGPLRRQLQKVTKALESASRERDHFSKLLESKRSEASKLHEKKGQLEVRMKNLELALRRNDPSELMKQLQASIDQVNTQLAHVQGKIEEIKGQVAEKESQLNPITEKERQLKSRVDELAKEKEQVSTVMQQSLSKFSRLNSQLVDINRRVNEMTTQLENLARKIPNQENHVQSLQRELESEIGASRRPQKIFTKNEIFERRLEATKELNFLSDPELEKRDVSREINQLETAIAKLQASLAERERDVERLQAELAAWNEEWTIKTEQTINSVNRLFNDILSEIGARGRLELINIQVPEEGQLYLRVQFPGEAERDIEAHSSGQKQVTLVAFILALQVLSGSPLTAIDEVDKGLDAFHQATFFEKLPILLKRAMTLRETVHASSFQPQVILVTPQYRPPATFEGDDHIVLVTAKTTAAV